MSSADSGHPRSRSPLAGAFNFRDLGGLPLADGRRTRHGLLFRSDTLQALTPVDVAAFTKKMDAVVATAFDDLDASAAKQATYAVHSYKPRGKP